MKKERGWLRMEKINTSLSTWTFGDLVAKQLRIPRLTKILENSIILYSFSMCCMYFTFYGCVNITVNSTTL